MNNAAMRRKGETMEKDDGLSESAKTSFMDCVRSMSDIQDALRAAIVELEQIKTQYLRAIEAPATVATDIIAPLEDRFVALHEKMRKVCQ